MPAIHSSPHPVNDPSIDWNPKEDTMPGNPYPNVGGGGVQPGYDAEQWTGVQSFAGREHDPGSMPMPNDNPVWSHASRFDTGSRSHTEREHSNRNQRHSRHPHTNHNEHNQNPHPWAHHQRSTSFDSRIPGRPLHARFQPEFDEEDEEWSDEENFEYDSYEEEEPAFFPPKMGRAGMGRARAWDSSDEEELGDEFDEDEGEDEDDEDDDSYAEEVRANMRQHGGGRMPQRGQPHRHQGGMRRSGPPPLQTPPDSPPPIARGIPPSRGMDPRMMRGRGMGARTMRGGRGMDPRMRTIPVRGGPPRGHATRKHTRFDGSPSSSSGGGWPFQYGAARLRRRSSAGGGIKKAMRWLKKPDDTPATLHPLLRTATLLRPPPLTWDVSRPPVAVRAGVPVGFGVASFSEPATSPPVTYMRLLVPIPGLDDAHWTVDVWPFGSPYASASQMPPSPYSFTGSPSAFARALPMSPFPGYAAEFGPPTPIVRCVDVLHALYTMLHRRAMANDFWALDERRRERVSRAFWVRCRMVGAAAMAGRNMDVGQQREPSPGRVEMDGQVNSGVKRIDFMEGRTRWDGLEGINTDEWLVKLGRT